MKNTNKEQMEMELKALEDERILSPGLYSFEKVRVFLKMAKKALLSRIREEVVGTDTRHATDSVNYYNELPNFTEEELQHEIQKDINAQNLLRATMREKLLEIEEEIC